ncbi:DUF6338 family protein [Serratia liquefaciens]|uniref:DUF6338 family protein n=1 Tax=Serratia liquefaciens TaxID=614 RepID=UPI00218320D0|nr:DUF6338 family protein [Serratia liquefaciens]CAI2430810.1 Uncharacterised protein [Serratia liquefaciens]
MESISGEIFTILKYLLPGLLSAWMFHAFTAYPKPSQFERIVLALIFTAFIQAGVYASHHALLFIGKYKSFGVWSSAAQSFWTYLWAITLGITFTIFSNNDKFHALLRFLKITSETSFHCEWYGTFKLNQDFVILHLKDDTKIYGWPSEWPSDPTKGHIVLSDPCWVKDDGYEYMPTVKLMMLSISEVKWVQFMQNADQGAKYVKESDDTATKPSNN